MILSENVEAPPENVSHSTINEGEEKRVSWKEEADIRDAIAGDFNKFRISPKTVHKLKGLKYSMI